MSPRGEDSRHAARSGPYQVALAVEFSRQIVLQLYKRRRELTLSFSRFLAKRLKLTTSKDDRVFLQFQTSAFSYCFKYVAHKADSGVWPLRMKDYAHLGDKFLKCVKSYKWWKGPSVEEMSKAMRFLAAVAQNIVKQYI
jgi:hypothetical protein